MTIIPASISDFIKASKAASFCCIDTLGHPYCFNAYYAFLEAEGWLVYKSGFSSHHESLLQQDPIIAGTIIPEELIVSTIRGVQFRGKQLPEMMEKVMMASGAYYLRYPFAMAVPGKIFLVQLDEIKFTDNTKGFGHKELWTRQQNAAQ